MSLLGLGVYPLPRKDCVRCTMKAGNPVLKSIGKKYGKSAVQIVLTFLVQKKE